MTIELVQSETEALIRERMAVGNFTDAESVILDALRTAPSPVREPEPKETHTWAQVIAAAQSFGGYDLDIERNRESNPNRDIDLS